MIAILCFSGCGEYSGIDYVENMYDNNSGAINNENSARHNSVLTLPKAQELLNNWGILFEGQRNLDSIHNLDLDRQVDGANIYGFVINFSSSMSLDSHGIAYAWVNSNTREIQFEEAGYSFVNGRNYYANIPDSMFPMPKRNGVIIPYECFLPPSVARGLVYRF